jgi:catecholate siderophore receptor
MGAFVASAAFAPPLAAPAHATELGRRLESLRIPVPSETARARALPAQAPRGDERQLRFDIPAAPLSNVLAEIERMSGVSIVITNTAIADISSPGVSGLFTPLEAIARALEGTSVPSRLTGPNRVSVEIRLTSEAVDVTGSIPQPRPSSPKYTQPLIEVPQTIEVIPREVMEAQGVTTLSEALRNVPGISLQAGEGGGASNTSGDIKMTAGHQSARAKRNQQLLEGSDVAETLGDMILTALQRSAGAFVSCAVDWRVPQPSSPMGRDVRQS